MDDWGMKVHLLEDILIKYRPKFIFTTPTFHNPTTTSMRKDRRERLIGLSEKYEIPIIEDDYGSDLQYSGIPLPPLKALDHTDEVIYIGTFSKIMVPGFRVGWIAAPKQIVDLLAEIKRFSDLCTSSFLQETIAEYMTRGFLSSHIQYLKKIYSRRLNCLIDSIKNFFPDETQFNRPNGGVYFWTTLPEYVDIHLLLETTLKKGVSFAPGDIFYLDSGGSHQMGLRFAFIEEEKIIKGIKIIGNAIEQLKCY